MNSPATAIAWEIWRKNQWALVTALVSIPFSFVLWAGFGTSAPEMVKIAELFLALISAANIFWAFSFTETDNRGRHSGFPARLFVLPVRTARLVSYPVLYGACSILLLYGGWMSAISLQWEARLAPGMLISAGAIVAGMMVSMQALAWALHRFNWLRMWVMIGVMVTQVLLILGCALATDERLFRWLSLEGLTILGVSISLLAYAGALLAVDRERRGDWLNFLEWPGRNQSGMQALGAQCFSSAATAQFWIEWRRRGWLTASVLAAVSAASLLIVPLAQALYLEPLLVELNFFITPMMALWLATCAGMQLGKSDTWSPELALHPITAMRPILTGDIIIAKMKVAAALTLVGALGFAILWFPATHAVGFLGRLNEQVLEFWTGFPQQYPALCHWLCHPVVILTTLGVTWHAIVRGMCPVLSGRVRKNVWAVGLGLSSFGLVVLAAGWLYHHQSQWLVFLELLPWITSAILGWKWIKAARAFWKVGPGDGGKTPSFPLPCSHPPTAPYSRDQCRGVFLLWLALTAGVAASAGLAVSARQIPTAVILFLAVCALPGDEIATCAVNLARNRHR